MLFFKAVAKKLKELDYGNSFDVLHIQSDFGIGIFNYIQKKIPTVITCHGCLKNELFASIKAKPYLIPIWLFAYPFYLSYEKSMLNYGDSIICVSKDLYRAIKGPYIKYSEKISVIYNGIDPQKYFYSNKIRKNFRKKYALSDNDFVLLFVGSLIMKKGLQKIISVLPEVIKITKKNVKLFIIGAGTYENSLKNKARKLNLNNEIIFLGKKSSGDLVNYYNLADLFVMPSLFIESFGLVLCESLLCGLPALATKIGAIPEIVDKKNGYLFKINDKEDLKNKLISAMTEDLTKKRYAGIDKIKEHFLITNMVSSYQKIYSKYRGVKFG